MRKGAVIVIILSFTGLAVFGFLGMGAHEMEHGGINGCLAALQREIGCPAPASPFEFATFHLSAFKIFSSANMGTAVLLSTVLTTLMLFLASLLVGTKTRRETILICKGSPDGKRQGKTK